LFSQLTLSVVTWPGIAVLPEVRGKICFSIYPFPAGTGSWLAVPCFEPRAPKWRFFLITNAKLLLHPAIVAEEAMQT
jgi:hypothetical protein